MNEEPRRAQHFFFPCKNSHIILINNVFLIKLFTINNVTPDEKLPVITHSCYYSRLHPN